MGLFFCNHSLELTYNIVKNYDMENLKITFIKRGAEFQGVAEFLGVMKMRSDYDLKKFEKDISYEDVSFHIFQDESIEETFNNTPSYSYNQAATQFADRQKCLDFIQTYLHEGTINRANIG